MTSANRTATEGDLDTRQGGRRLERLESAATGAQRWAYFGRARRDLVFVNPVGDLAHLPEALGRVIRESGRLDTQIIREGVEVSFIRRGEVVARIPTTLFVQLNGLLADVPGLSNSWLHGSQSWSESKSQTARQP